MSVEEAAKAMGVSIQFLRMGLRQNKFPFGVAVEMSPNSYRYWISRERFEQYMNPVHNHQ